MPSSGGSCKGAYMSSSGHLLFEVRLLKPQGTKLGIDVLVLGAAACSSSGLIVDKITQNGLAEAWNARSTEPYRIRTGDIIICVNGVEGDSLALSNELRSDSDMYMAVLRINHEAGASANAADARMEASWRQLGVGAEAAGSCPMPPPVGQQMMAQLFHTYQAQMKQLHHQHMQQTQLLQREWQEQQLHLLRLQRMKQLHTSGATQIPQWYAGKGAGRQGFSQMGAGNAHDTSFRPAHPATRSTAAVQALAAYKQYTFDVHIMRPEGARLGFGVLPVMVGDLDVLLVRQINLGGLIDQWNQTCREGSTIREGDAVVAVNEISLDVQLMMDEVRSRPDLYFTILPQHAYRGVFLEEVSPMTLVGSGVADSREEAGAAARAGAHVVERLQDRPSDKQALLESAQTSLDGLHSEQPQQAHRPKQEQTLKTQDPELEEQQQPRTRSRGPQVSAPAGLKQAAEVSASTLAGTVGKTEPRAAHSAPQAKGSVEPRTATSAPSAKAPPSPSPVAVPVTNLRWSSSYDSGPPAEASDAPYPDDGQPPLHEGGLARLQDGADADNAANDQAADEAELLLELTSLAEDELSDLLEAALEDRPWLLDPIMATLEVLERNASAGPEAEAVERVNT